MAGVFSALKVGNVILDGDNRVVACCRQFARLLRRDGSELISTCGWDLVVEEDRAPGRYLMENVWKGDEPLTLLSRLLMPDGEVVWFESCVQRLLGLGCDAMLSVIRPFNMPRDRGPDGPAPPEGQARYVVDMAQQLGAIALEADMPFTSELLRAATRLGREEVGLN